MKKTHRCLYCGHIIDSQRSFCHEICQQKYEKQVTADNQRIPYFIAGLLFSLVGIFIGVILETNLFVIGISILFLGFIILAMPFSTPEIVQKLGYQKPRFLARALGIFVIGVGLWLNT